MNDDDAGSRYDHLASMARLQSGAHAVALIVMGGIHGSGFAVQAHDSHFANVLLPDLLEEIARQIRAQHAAATKKENQA